MCVCVLCLWVVCQWNWKGGLCFFLHSWSFLKLFACVVFFPLLLFLTSIYIPVKAYTINSTTNHLLLSLSLYWIHFTFNLTPLLTFWQTHLHSSPWSYLSSHLQTHFLWLYKHHYSMLKEILSETLLHFTTLVPFHTCSELWPIVYTVWLQKSIQFKIMLFLNIK